MGGALYAIFSLAAKGVEKTTNDLSLSLTFDFKLFLLVLLAPLLKWWYSERGWPRTQATLFRPSAYLDKY